MDRLITLWHLTPVVNRESIEAFGVMPSLSEGRRQWSYWVEEDRIYWAIAHVCARRSLTPSALCICLATIEAKYIIRTCFRGVYGVDIVVRPSDIFPLAPSFIYDTLNE